MQGWQAGTRGSSNKFSPMGLVYCLCPGIALYFGENIGYVITYGVDANAQQIAYFFVYVTLGY